MGKKQGNKSNAETSVVVAAGSVASSAGNEDAKLAKLKEVCGVTGDLARKLLADHNGDVDAAVAAKIADDQEWTTNSTKKKAAAGAKKDSNPTIAAVATTTVAPIAQQYTPPAASQEKPKGKKEQSAPVASTTVATVAPVSGGMAKIDLASLSLISAAPVTVTVPQHQPVVVANGASDAVKSGAASIAALQKASDAKFSQAAADLTAAFNVARNALAAREQFLATELNNAHKKEGQNIAQRQAALNINAEHTNNAAKADAASWNASRLIIDNAILRSAIESFGTVISPSVAYVAPPQQTVTSTPTVVQAPIAAPIQAKAGKDKKEKSAPAPAPAPASNASTSAPAPTPKVAAAEVPITIRPIGGSTAPALPIFDASAIKPIGSVPTVASTTDAPKAKAAPASVESDDWNPVKDQRPKKPRAAASAK